MSDDLVKRLREDQPVTQDMASTMQCALQDAAADRIEELELAVRYEADLAQQALDARKELAAKLAKAVKSLEYYGGWSDGSSGICGFDGGSRARTTLAELKGQDDE